ncbi:MAG: hypothetical protein KDC53_21635, partial [Saprospiraceae bacterium]|nr:hypothetical protein [Saprospiraceae bacterium]
MRGNYYYWWLLILILAQNFMAGQNPADLHFVRQGVKRLIFSPEQSISLASFEPDHIVGLSSMHPVRTYESPKPEINIESGQLVVQAGTPSEAGIWFAGFNPFATYDLQIDEVEGRGRCGFEFSGPSADQRFILSLDIDG